MEYTAPSVMMILGKSLPLTKSSCFYVGAWIALWAVLFFDAIASMVGIWAGSNVFTHGFFIVPLALYFAYQDRWALAGQTLQPAWYMVPLLAVWLFVWGLGEAGDIQLFQHFALTSVVPLVVFMAFGRKAFQKHWFPLTFIFFCIPFGEELVPFLQSVTASNAVTMLRWTGVPVLSDGLYITIPEGKFVVAEACSGVRFLIATVCLGYYFAYIAYTSLLRRAVFVVAAILAPIAANSLRVYGVIMIGHWSDMKYAVGADHLLYGWFFFVAILFLLL